MWVLLSTGRVFVAVFYQAHQGFDAITKLKDDSHPDISWSEDHKVAKIKFSGDGSVFTLERTTPTPKTL